MKKVGAIFAALFATAVSSYAGWEWERLGRLTPEAMVYPAMAYDSKQRQVLLLTGPPQYLFLPLYAGEGRLWARKDGKWCHIEGSDAPGRPARAGAAFDEKRGVLVVYGGIDRYTTQPPRTSNTLEWNGSEWNQPISSRDPGPIQFPVMTYDAQSETVLLFDSPRLYSYDGNAWRVVSTGPQLTTAYMAHDRDRSVTVVCGRSGETYETWEWDGSKWEKVIGFTPAIYFRSPFAYDESARVIRTFAAGAGDNPSVRASWEYADRAWRMVLEENFAPVNSGMVFDRDLGVMLSFGGSVGLGTDVEQHWIGNRWEDVDSEPSARYGGAMAYDKTRGQVVLFGGLNWPVTFPNDTWVFEGNRWRKVDTSTSPPSGFGYAHAFDERRDVLVVTGGYDHFNQLQETWVWDGLDWAKAGLPPVAGWGTPPLYYDDSMEMVVMGTSDHGTFGFDGAQWVQLNPNGPRTPGDFAVYDVHRNTPVAVRAEGSIWELQARSWNEVHPRPWSPRLLVSAAAYHPERRCIVFLGGRDANFVGDPIRSIAMTWDGTNLEFLRTTATPSYRLAPHVVYDSKTNRLVMYGGLAPDGSSTTGYVDGTARTETWSLRWRED